MPRSLHKKRAVKKIKKEKIKSEVTETKEVPWRLPPFPYEKKREVIIDGAVVTTVDILKFPGKSNSGCNYSTSVKYNSPEDKVSLHLASNDVSQAGKGETGKDEHLKLENEKIILEQGEHASDEDDRGQQDVDVDQEEVQEELHKIEGAVVDEITRESNGIQRMEWSKKKKHVKNFVEYLNNVAYDSHTFSVSGRVIDFLRKISVKTRLGYPIAVKMSVHPKVRIIVIAYYRRSQF